MSRLTWYLTATENENSIAIVSVEFFYTSKGIYMRTTGRWSSMAVLFIVLLLLAANSFVASAQGVNSDASTSSNWQEPPNDEGQTASFTIRRFDVRGNTLLPTKLIELDEEMPLSTPNLADILEEFIGDGKTIQDIEAARAKLENTYHNLGYPTVLVNIPEQTVDGGLVRLDVVEGKVRRVRVTGNHYFTMENIMEDIPTLKEGSLIYLPRLQEELAVVNTHQDMKVEPTLMPGKDFGTVDVELKVEDKMPIHGSLELNNRASDNTHALRINGTIRYDNLWQKGHSASGQFQISPQDINEVQVLSSSYVMPPPWQDEHRLALYGIWSDSQTAFGEGFLVTGAGFIAGARYVIPLTPYQQYSHNLTVGLDYKDFKETVGFGGDPDLLTPMQYWPMSFSYSGSMPDSGGVTVFSAGLNMSFRELAADPEQFAIKRYKSRGGYLYGTFGVERRQKMPWQTDLYLKLDGQIASEPLISNEQYVTGGMESMRAYKESAEAADNAFHFVSEWSGRDVWKSFGIEMPGGATPYIFYEFADLAIKSPLGQQDASFNLSDTGVGVRGMIASHYSYEINWATALTARSDVRVGDQRLYFLMKYKF